MVEHLLINCRTVADWWPIGDSKVAGFQSQSGDEIDWRLWWLVGGWLAISRKPGISLRSESAAASLFAAQKIGCNSFCSATYQRPRCDHYKTSLQLQQPLCDCLFLVAERLRHCHKLCGTGALCAVVEKKKKKKKKNWYFFYFCKKKTNKKKQNNKNICCWYPLEVPYQGTSNEYQQHMFLLNTHSIRFYWVFTAYVFIEYTQHMFLLSTYNICFYWFYWLLTTCFN